MSIRTCWVLVLVSLTSGLVWAGSEDLHGHFRYHSWKSGSGSSLGEGLRVYTSDARGARTEWLIRTPSGNRVLVVEEYDPGEDRWTTRFRDLESQWWAEDVVDSPLSYRDLADHEERAFGTYLDAKPPLDISFRTADGLSLHETLVWKELEAEKRGRDIHDLLREWATDDRREALDLRESTVEAIRFLVSLREAGVIEVDDPMHQASVSLEALLHTQGDLPETFEYGAVHWIEGEVQRSRVAAVDELLVQFENDEDAKRSTRWIQRRPKR